MRIVVCGAGAVGGYYGGKLALAGHETFFIVREKSLEHFHRNGLTVMSFDGDFTIMPPVGATSEGFGVADLVIVAVKAPHLDDALPLFSSSMGPKTKIVSLMNGIDSEEIIAARYGADAVIGGIAFIGATNDGPGLVTHNSYGRAAVGPWTPASADAARILKEAFDAAGVKCKLSSDIRFDLWTKLLWNVGFNAVCALADAPTSQTTGYGPTRELSRVAMRELVAVAQAMGIMLTEEMVEKNIETTSTGGEVYPSMLQDMRAGRLMEVDLFNGRVSSLGKELGIPTPVNDTLAALTGIRNQSRSL
ncbi:MAG: 2-dehydropantoate 2-reductase [Nitrospinae bacterium]|nr:2-dehydropantoate 2-reductase [Nitrospinota bacterium]